MGVRENIRKHKAGEVIVFQHPLQPPAPSARRTQPLPAAKRRRPNSPPQLAPTVNAGSPPRPAAPLNSPRPAALQLPQPQPQNEHNVWEAMLSLAQVGASG